ncbi:hypothetical protein JCM10908_000772 [Rhodotorula pacifica]|uniref:Hsp70 family protein n=1 Tax=Rhodotorula pacifica TaxID=1495444 RepID=UPI00316F783F
MAVKAYQEIVRASSRRDPASGRAQPPIASTSTLGASSTLHSSTTAAIPTASKKEEAPAATTEKKSRFHRLARLQIGGLHSSSSESNKDKGKGKGKAAKGDAAARRDEDDVDDELASVADEDGDARSARRNPLHGSTTRRGGGGRAASDVDDDGGTYNGPGALAVSRRQAPHYAQHHHPPRYPQQFLAPPQVGPNGVLMYPPPPPLPPPPMGYPYPYPPPPPHPGMGMYPGYPYGPYPGQQPQLPPPSPRRDAPYPQYSNGYSSPPSSGAAALPPPLSAAASSSAARTNTGTGASTSPTSPNTPTSAAHYYPYVASQAKQQRDFRASRDAMASPQSFKSRGSGGQDTTADGGGEEGREEGGGEEPVNADHDARGGGDDRDAAREALGNGYANGFAPPPHSASTNGRVVSGGSAASNGHLNGHGNGNGSTLPPGAAPPLRSPPSLAPSHRSGRSLAATSHRSGRSSRPAPAPAGPPQMGPPSAYPAGYAPYPPYPFPAPPPGYPPYGYPPYPGYPPPPPPPPPHMRLAPPSPAPTASTARGRASVASVPAPGSPPRAGRNGRTAGAPQSIATVSYPYPYPYAPMVAPLSPPLPPSSQAGALSAYGGGGGTYDPAVYAVAQNMERERERLRLRTDLGGPMGTSKGKERETLASSSSVMNARGQAKTQAQREDEGKMSVGIDFGTTFSGIAYGSSRVFDGQIRQILNWPGSYETYRKVPTCILYEQHDPSEEAKIVSWGLEAKNTTVREGFVKCEWFKLLLSPESLRSGVPDPWLPPLPVGKNVVDVIADFLRCIWRYARRVITEEIGSVVDLNAADVLLTVPAAWDAAACSLMRESALRAGLVQSSRGGDTQWRDRLQIITEPEAGAIHASTLATLHHLRPSQSFLLCDAGGGTVDTAVYKLMGQLSELEIAEMCVRSGANTGSLFVDLKFEELLRRILKDHPVHLEPASMATFIHAFAEGDKLAYHGTAEDDEAIFRFNCFNVEDSHDPSVGLEYGELAIPGKMLKTEVFDPIIDQVLELLSTQIAKIGHTSLDAIILVGGFSASEYLYTRVRQAFGADVPVVVRPQDCDTATLRGAARYGLGLKMGRGGVSSVISPRSYCMKSKLPADEEDHWRRPEYVTTNDGGTVVCENRLSYLIAKGAVLRKGERLRSRFCKFIKDPHDSVFTAHLFVSNSEELYRYTDEGDLAELCRWTVDLAALPRFRELERNGGGYIEFDLGLQLDSAEVRGVLMTEDGIECGAATFEFLGT